MVTVSLPPCLHVSVVPSSDTRLFPVNVSVVLIQVISVLCISPTVTPVTAGFRPTSELLEVPTLMVSSPLLEKMELAQMTVLPGWLQV